MTPEQLFDEQMVAKIIAAAEGSGVKVQRGVWGAYNTGLRVVPDGPCCAVGAGCMYRTLSRDELQRAGSEGPELFAVVHDVDPLYAHGISNAFEMINRLGRNAQYERGWSVGEAVRAYFEDAQ